MSGSRWMTTPWWLSRSLSPFLCSSVYSCHLFLISSASVRSLVFIMSVLAWNVPLASLIFLKSWLVFPSLLFSSISFKKAFLSLLWEKRSIYSLKLCIQLVNQSCVILCDPMELLPVSSVYGILQERILVGSHSLIQWFFPTQGLNLGLLHCRQILHCLRGIASPFSLAFHFSSLLNYL